MDAIDTTSTSQNMQIVKSIQSNQGQCVNSFTPQMVKIGGMGERSQSQETYEEIDVETVDFVNIPAEVLRNALYRKCSPTESEYPLPFTGENLSQYFIGT